VIDDLGAPSSETVFAGDSKRVGTIAEHPTGVSYCRTDFRGDPFLERLRDPFRITAL
jgi:hypothetical protein